MFTKTILLASSLALSTLAAPLEVRGAGITAAQIQAIAPATASCPAPAGQCATAASAATALNHAFDKYGITTAGEQAALVAYMLFESGSFKYNHNLNNAGQGTRMMAMPPFVSKYATAAVGAPAVAAAGNSDGVLALVNANDDLSFGMAAWFLTTQCTPAVRQGLQAGTAAGWQGFITGCVGTTDTAERDALWTAAKGAIH